MYSNNGEKEVQSVQKRLSSAPEQMRKHTTRLLSADGISLQFKR